MYNKDDNDQLITFINNKKKQNRWIRLKFVPTLATKRTKTKIPRKQNINFTETYMMYFLIINMAS
jgi:hypothetical protein